jgi:hypothetical protein
MATNQRRGRLAHLRRAALLPDGGDMTDGQLLGCFITRHDEAAFAALGRATFEYGSEGRGRR